MSWGSTISWNDAYGRTAEYNAPPAVASGGRIDKIFDAVDRSLETINRGIATFGRNRTRATEIPAVAPEPPPNMAQWATLSNPWLIGAAVILLVLALAAGMVKK